jgi:beta-glucosidase
VTAVGTDVEDRARELLNRLTTTEKLRMLTGDQDLYRDMMDFGGDHERRVQTAAAVPRLGLGGLHFVDGPRGVAVGKSTCFPAAIARAAAFDYDLEERVGEAIGREARAQGANWCGAPCLNLLRHPGWGRAQETYGESSDHIGEMGAAAPSTSPATASRTRAFRWT